jgi:hypothetical protein
MLTPVVCRGFDNNYGTTIFFGNFNRRAEWGPSWMPEMFIERPAEFLFYA